jgi:hypothetical protein
VPPPISLLDASILTALNAVRNETETGDLIARGVRVGAPLYNITTAITNAAPEALTRAVALTQKSWGYKARAALLGFSTMADLAAYSRSRKLFDWVRPYLAMAMDPVAYFEQLRREKESRAVHERRDSEELMHDLQKLERTRTDEATELFSLMQEETALQVHADLPTDHEKHSHLKQLGFFQSLEAHPDLHARYNALASDVKALHKRVVEYFRKELIRVQKAAIQAELNHRLTAMIREDLETPGGKAPDKWALEQSKDGFEAMADRFFNDKQTDQDIAFYAGD